MARCLQQECGAFLSVSVDNLIDIYQHIMYFRIISVLDFVSPVLTEVSNPGKFINLEFLTLRGMGIIKSPLLERNVSADKI